MSMITTDSEKKTWEWSPTVFSPDMFETFTSSHQFKFYISMKLSSYLYLWFFPYICDDICFPPHRTFNIGFKKRKKKVVEIKQMR